MIRLLRLPRIPPSRSSTHPEPGFDLAAVIQDPAPTRSVAGRAIPEVVPVVHGLLLYAAQRSNLRHSHEIGFDVGVLVHRDELNYVQCDTANGLDEWLARTKNGSTVGFLVDMHRPNRVVHVTVFEASREGRQKPAETVRNWENISLRRVFALWGSCRPS
jgi:hypothetical protein